MNNLFECNDSIILVIHFIIVSSALKLNFSYKKIIFKDNLFDRAVINACTSATENMPLHKRNQLGKVLFVLSSL